ncbi:MAG: ribonuclease III [Nitrospirae bacterium]|nr:ribonuclease III [Nitrospirota bacterium]
MHALFLESIARLEAAIGYLFKDKSLISEALTHKSFANENPEIAKSFNERMEFLGDAVLGLIVSDYLFSAYPKYSEAEFSRIKAYAVQENTLAEVATGLNIGSCLFLGKGEEASGGRKKPSLLANAFEAVLAAVYLDSGLIEARDFTLRVLKDRIEKVISGELLFDFKTRFQELVQEKYGILPKYVVHKETGPEHIKIFEVKVFIGDELYGAGNGRSKKEAAQMAAEEGLRKLGEGEGGL